MSLEEQTIEQTEESTDFEDEVEVDTRLQSAVELLKKQTGIDGKQIQGMTVEEQYDFLDRYIKVQPKGKVKRNKPVRPVPTATQNPSFGKLIENSKTHHRWEVRTKDIIKGLVK